MYTITFAGIIAAISELQDHGISRCLPLFEERLYLAFGCLPQPWKQRTKGEKESRSTYEARYKNNRAQRTYLTALNKNPYFFLPYLLVVSPRQVKTQAATKLLKHEKVKDCQFKLAAEAKKTLDEIADRKGFKNDPRYQNLILTFFPRKIPQGFLPIDVEDENRDLWLFEVSDSIASIDLIRDASALMASGVESSKLWQAERTQPGERSKCVKVIMRSGESDGWICYRVGWRIPFEVRDILMEGVAPVRADLAPS